MEYWPNYNQYVMNFMEGLNSALSAATSDVSPTQTIVAASSITALGKVQEITGTGTIITIKNVSYSVAEIIPDGTGLSRLNLTKQD